ncbi:sulfoxide reductase heme-binding subunit YedZ [Granulicella aggregans]|uniref:Sulfoxide reductase heme-binding subunit YedZ n=1 Tax=Granulicella aggregans TaxID=474949 RepID=A0A7W8E398_9BACT|nr:ferric reductase-like transmembrane domain-containing protein [Granulicella aggregans]MBB5057362.1 sulfoxide reductase heme-binding subunit YedZ [Granulicella aggregans]
MPSLQRTRLYRRLLAHHLPLLLFTALAVSALFITRPYRDTISRLSFATAYPALIFIAATLLIGPWNILRARRNPVSSDLRRDLGIWAGILAVLHSGIGQAVHLRGRPWLYYVYGPTEHHSFPIRHDLFGLANYTGAISVLVVAALLATSNDLSLRRLGTPQWKRLQRWNYAAFALAAVHTIAYLVSEKQHVPWVALAAFSILITLCLQIAGFRRRSSHTFANRL